MLPPHIHTLSNLFVVTAVLGRRGRLGAADGLLLLHFLLLLQLVLPRREGQRDALGRRHVPMLVRVPQTGKGSHTAAVLLFDSAADCSASCGRRSRRKRTKKGPKKLPGGTRLGRSFPPVSWWWCTRGVRRIRSAVVEFRRRRRAGGRK